MASIAISPNGTRRIVWAVNGRQLAIRLGRTDAKGAAAVKLHVERLIVAWLQNTPPAADTAVWLNRVSDVLHDRITRTGLCDPRTASDMERVGGAFDAFTASRRNYVKAGTSATWPSAASTCAGT